MSQTSDVLGASSRFDPIGDEIRAAAELKELVGDRLPLNAHLSPSIRRNWSYLRERLLRPAAPKRQLELSST